MLSKLRFGFLGVFLSVFILVAAPLSAAPKDESPQKEDKGVKSTSGGKKARSKAGSRSSENKGEKRVDTPPDKKSETKTTRKPSEKKENKTAKAARDDEKAKAKTKSEPLKKTGDKHANSAPGNKSKKTMHKSSKKKPEESAKSARDDEKAEAKTKSNPSKKTGDKNAASANDRKKTKAKAKSKPSTKPSLGPISERQPKSSHAPFESGDCDVCHKTNDKKDPGPVTTASSELCFTCHEEFSNIMAKPHLHPPAEEACVNCHNPHNSLHAKLLFNDRSALCLDCHKPIEKLLATANIQHGAVTSGAKCAGCHNPHASEVEHLLVQLPFDLCIGCHSKDDLADSNGKKLTNFKKLLAKNPVHHAPVASKDCSACHMPHGSKYFRLLKAEYPKKFYSPYNPKNYKLCFECHNDKIAAVAKTTTLTNFRDGDNNLHFFHVNRIERGRTCRACHEVHASKQPHQIRDNVPYGTKGWKLKIKFTPLSNGGACEKTCHSKRVYTAKDPDDKSKRVAEKNR